MGLWQLTSVEQAPLVAWVTPLCSQTPGSHLSLLWLESGCSMEQERCPPAFFLVGWKGQRGPQRGYRCHTWIYRGHRFSSHRHQWLAFSSIWTKCHRNRAKGIYKHCGRRKILFLSASMVWHRLARDNLDGHALLKQVNVSQWAFKLERRGEERRPGYSPCATDIRNMVKLQLSTKP